MTLYELREMPHLKAIAAGYKWYTFKLVPAGLIEAAQFDFFSMRGDRPRSDLNGSDDQYVATDYWMLPQGENEAGLLKLRGVSDN